MNEPKWPHFGFLSAEINVRHFHVQFKSFLPPPQIYKWNRPKCSPLCKYPQVCAVNLQKVAQHSCPIMYGCIAATVYGLPTRPSKLLRWWSTVCLIQYCTALYVQCASEKTAYREIKRKYLRIKGQS